MNVTDHQLPQFSFPRKTSYSLCANHLTSEGFFVPDDVVFMADEAQRNEYVLNDTGYIYVGSAYNIYNRPWNFGQVKYSYLAGVMTLIRSLSFTH